MKRTQLHIGDWAQADSLTYDNGDTVYNVEFGEGLGTESLAMNEPREKALEAVRGTIQDLQSILGWLEGSE